MQKLLMTSLGRLRILAFAEGVSFLVILFITMPLKYYFDYPEANKVVGMAHGVLFVLYIFLVIQVGLEHNWKFKRMALAFLASIIPFGTFWADKHLFQAST